MSKEKQQINVDKLICSLIKRNRGLSALLRSCLHEQGLRYNIFDSTVEKIDPSVIITPGQMFYCKKDLYNGDVLVYQKGEFYNSERPNCITDESDEVHHRWYDRKKVDEYFEKC